MSKDISYYGPTSGEPVGSSEKQATHNIFTAVTWGFVKKYNYRVETVMGDFLRNESVYVLSNVEMYEYCQNASATYNTIYESAINPNKHKTASSLSEAARLMANEPEKYCFW